MHTLGFLASLYATHCLARPFTASPPLLSNLTTTTTNSLSSNKTTLSSPFRTNLTGSSLDLHETIFEDALEVLLAASPTHDEYMRTSDSLQSYDHWDFIDLLNDGIASSHDGSPIGPDTPPQEIEQKQAPDFATLVRDAAPFMSEPLGTLPHLTVWELKWNPRARELHEGIRDIVKYAFSRKYFGDPDDWGLALKVLDAIELGDLIMWINDIKEARGDTTGRLSTQSSVDDLWNKVWVQDLEQLCDAIEHKTVGWASIPWPANDPIARHRREIQRGYFQGVLGNATQTPGEVEEVVATS